MPAERKSLNRCHCDLIESVQNSNAFPSFEARLDLIKVQTLERRRAVLGVCFVFNLIKGDIDSDVLLHKLNFNIPARYSRHYRPFSLDFYRTNYGCNFPFRRLYIDFNF